MNPLRLIPLAFALAAPVCLAQLPPSLVRPGQPVPPAPVVPSPAVPTFPAVPEVPAPEGTQAAGLPNTLTPEDQAQGWKLLFDGKRLYGVRGLQKADPLSAGWKIQDGELNLPKDVKDMERMTGGDIVTLDFYWDFEFRFEWKTSVAANSGVRYMLVERVGEVPVGLEYQIIDDVHNSISLRGGPLRRSGSLDNILPVGPNAKLRVADPLNKIGDPWNEGRIVVQGTHVEHWMNGEKVLEFELGPQIRKIALANMERDMQQLHKGTSAQEIRRASEARVPVTLGMKSRTRIALVDQGTEIAFRNLKIRTLAPQAVVLPGTGTPRPAGTIPNPLLIPRSK